MSEQPGPMRALWARGGNFGDALPISSIIGSIFTCVTRFIPGPKWQGIFPLKLNLRSGPRGSPEVPTSVLFFSFLSAIPVQVAAAGHAGRIRRLPYCVRNDISADRQSWTGERFFAPTGCGPRPSRRRPPFAVVRPPGGVASATENFCAVFGFYTTYTHRQTSLMIRWLPAEAAARIRRVRDPAGLPVRTKPISGRSPVGPGRRGDGRRSRSPVPGANRAKQSQSGRGLKFEV